LGRFLDLGGNYDATSTAVAVHRSTLRYRLQRIRDISGRDLNDPDVRFNLQLATRALETLHAMGGGLMGSTESRAQ
jgi:DNA-binding PucR family transcriptional regulator